MADTEQLIGVPIENLQDALSYDLTDDSKVIVEDETQLTRKSRLKIIAEWILKKLTVNFAEDGSDTLAINKQMNPLSSGIAKISKENAPGGAEKTMAYICFGSEANDNVRVMIVVDKETGDTYLKLHSGNTYNGWMRIPVEIYSNLTTKNKSSIVSAINELNEKSYNSEKTVRIGKKVISDTVNLWQLTGGGQRNIGSDEEEIDNDYYSTVSGDDAKITVKKDGLYQLFVNNYAAGTDGTASGTLLTYIYNDDEILLTDSVYLYGSMACRRNISRVAYLSAGASLHVKVGTSAATSGTINFKGGYLEIVKLD